MNARATKDSQTRLKIVEAARRLVVKVGSSVLSSGQSRLDPCRIHHLSLELSSLRESGREVILVSSGAILAGLGQLKWKERPKEIPLKQAAAAIGQGRLMWAYQEAFQFQGQMVAQVLLTQEDVRDRSRYLNARNTLLTLLSLEVIPVINENDTVAVEEIKFGDNDQLSALVANLVDADLLIILTDTEGLYTADPRKDRRARLVPVVREITANLTLGAEDSGSAVSVGGMSSKLLAAKVATASAIPTIVANGKTEGVLGQIMEGKVVGTLFLPESDRMASRKRWLAFASHSQGKISVDKGAKSALIRRGKSLLPSGVMEARGDFRAGDVVSLLDERNLEFAKGLVNYGVDEVNRIKGCRSSQIEKILGYKHSDEIIHRDNLVVMERSR
jgi:glutamate 5-kinase